MIRSNDRAPVPPRLAQGKCAPNYNRMRETVLRVTLRASVGRRISAVQRRRRVMELFILAGVLSIQL